MGFFRSSRNRQLDGFGPGDTLLAAASTLKHPLEQELVRSLVLDDDMNSRAQAMFRDLNEFKLKQLFEACDQALTNCERGIRGQPELRLALEIRSLSLMLMACREVVSPGSSERLGDEESLFVLASLRGASRMLELRRREQAKSVLGYAIGIGLYLTSVRLQGAREVPDDLGTKFHRATWDSNNCSDMHVNGYEIRDGAELSKANLSNANLSNANLSQANLDSANLSRSDLSYANLSNANLTQANLDGANLSYANLSHANLSCAKLRRTNLTGTNLTNVSLWKANLRGANLSGANLTNAELINADLTGADMWKANLMNANLDGANIAYASMGRPMQFSPGRLKAVWRIITWRKPD